MRAPARALVSLAVVAAPFRLTDDLTSDLVGSLGPWRLVGDTPPANG